MLRYAIVTPPRDEVLPVVAELGTPLPAAPSRRERARQATVDEIKATALDLMREHATTDVRFTDIARVMGMTAPALYRYFDDRDELLSALIVDGFDSLGAAVAEAVRPLDEADLPARWSAASQAYRAWASAEPQMFALILGMPVPGYQAPEEGPTTEAAKAAMSQLSSLFVAAAQRGELRPPLIREVSVSMADCERSKHDELCDVLAPESFQAMLQTWAMLHGFVSLEAYGHFDWMEPEARDALFRSHMRLAATASGLPVPPA
jgi:AcrR family transcriptional regulator